MSSTQTAWLDKSHPEHEEPELNSQPEDALAIIPDSAVELVKDAGGIKLTANIVINATAHLPEKQRVLLRYLHHVAREKNWTWKDIERETKISHNSIYRILTDRYRYPQTETRFEQIDGKRVAQKVPHPRAEERIPIDQLVGRLARWRTLYEARLPLAGVGGAFLETSTFRRLNWLCGRCFIRKALGFAYGDGQIGKTEAAKERQRRHNHGITTYYECLPGGTARTFMIGLARALNANPGKDWYALLKSVADAVDDSKQIIFDEASRIFTLFTKAQRDKCMDGIRYIHDRRKVSMIFIATNVFRDELHKGEFIQFFSQFTRRSPYEIQLPSVAEREDLDLFAAQYGLKPATGSAETIMWDIAEKDGLGKYIIRLQDAVEIAANGKDKLTWAHFEKAHLIALKNTREIKFQRARSNSVVSC